MLTMLVLATMCVGGLLATWLIVRSRHADRPRIAHWLAVAFAFGVACVGGIPLVLSLILSDRAQVESVVLCALIALVGISLFIAAGGPEDQASRQIAKIACSFVLVVAIVVVGMFALFLHALRGPQPPNLSKLQSKFPQRRSQLELLAAVEAPLGVQLPKSLDEIQREKRLAPAEPPASFPRRVLNLFSHEDARPRVVYQDGAILFVYGNEDGLHFGGGHGPSWGYLYCPDSPDGNRASICRDAAILSGADWGPPSLLSLRLDQHWFAYSRGPSS